jgi:sulfatase maturation enzyme AslB (radical SAM superfamily)
MSIAEWHNSEPMCDARLRMNSDIKMHECSACWYQEEFSNTSRRYRSNAKSVIFKSVFDESLKQSPNHSAFDYSFNSSGKTTQMPIDLHINLGNYCDLACKYCCPEASSKIASQYIKWDVGGDGANNTVLTDWTRDNDTWNRFLDEISKIKNLQNLHFMGGETLISKRFEELVDKLTEYEMFDVCFSFVSNGMSFNAKLIKKLSRFKRVGIEVSIETTTKHNEYIRQGTNNDLVLSNIKKYIDIASSGSIDFTIRPAVSLLSIGYYHTVLQFCLDNKILLKSNNVLREVGWMSSKCLDVRVLPIDIRRSYLGEYTKILKELSHVDCIDEFNESDSHNYVNVVKTECEKCISLLTEEYEHDLYPDLIELLSKWDSLHGFNAKEYYPELKDLLTKHNYQC